jgi:hypothetical protein
LSVVTMNVQGLTRNMWGTEADTLSPLLSGLHLRCADVVCLQELGLLCSDIPELQSRCNAAGYTAFVAPLHHPNLNPRTFAPAPLERRVLGRGTLILIRNELVKYAALVPCFSSHRAIAIRLLIHNVCRFHILGIYAPTGSSADIAAERRKYWQVSEPLLPLPMQPRSKRSSWETSTRLPIRYSTPLRQSPRAPHPSLTCCVAHSV